MYFWIADLAVGFGSWKDQAQPGVEAPAPRRATRLAWLRQGVARLFAAIRRRHLRLQGVRDLDRLSDRLLGDVGLTRFDVEVMKLGGERQPRTESSARGVAVASVHRLPPPAPADRQAKPAEAAEWRGAA